MASRSCPPNFLLRSHFPAAEAAAADLQTPPTTAATTAAAATAGLNVKVTTVIKVAKKASKPTGWNS